MFQYLKGLQKYNRQKLKALLLLSQFRSFYFDLPLFWNPFRYKVIWLVPHWKALIHGKDNSTGQSCDRNLNIHQEVLKSWICYIKRILLILNLVPLYFFLSYISPKESLSSNIKKPKIYTYAIIS